MSCVSELFSLIGFSIMLGIGLVSISIVCFGTWRRAMITVLIVAFCIGECMAYSHAKWPERMNSVLYKLPGGGIAALLLLGREKGDQR